MPGLIHPSSFRAYGKHHVCITDDPRPQSLYLPHQHRPHPVGSVRQDTRKPFKATTHTAKAGLTLGIVLAVLFCSIYYGSLRLPPPRLLQVGRDAPLLLTLSLRLPGRSRQLRAAHQAFHGSSSCMVSFPDNTIRNGGSMISSAARCVLRLCLSTRTIDRRWEVSRGAIGLMTMIVRGKFL